MKIYKNVVVFKGYNGNNAVEFTNPVSCFINFDNKMPIGSAELRHENGVTYADITIPNEQDNGMAFMIDCSYPASGGIVDGDGAPFKIKMIGLCSNQNVDPDIVQMYFYADKPVIIQVDIL